MTAVRGPRGRIPFVRSLLLRFVVPLSVAALAAGCADLLPRGSADTVVSWESFDEARQAIEEIVPYQTHRSDLSAKGFDPRQNPAISLLTYSDLVQRFAVGSVVRPEELDRGISECLRAGKACTGYAITAKKTKRERVGSFWVDTLGFKRQTEITGWTFNALVIFVDDLAVYTLYGGTPNMHETEVTRNPLGPLQGLGERLGRF